MASRWLKIILFVGISTCSLNAAPPWAGVAEYPVKILLKSGGPVITGNLVGVAKKAATIMTTEGKIMDIPVDQVLKAFDRYGNPVTLAEPPGSREDSAPSPNTGTARVGTGNTGLDYLGLGLGAAGIGSFIVGCKMVYYGRDSQQSVQTGVVVAGIGAGMALAGYFILFKLPAEPAQAKGLLNLEQGRLALTIPEVRLSPMRTDLTLFKACF